MTGHAAKSTDTATFKVYCKSVDNWKTVVFEGDIIARPNADNTFGLWDIALCTCLNEDYCILIIDNSGVDKGAFWFTYDPPTAFLDTSSKITLPSKIDQPADRRLFSCFDHNLRLTI